MHGVIYSIVYEFSVVIVTGRANFMINKVIKDKVVLPKAQNMISSRRCFKEDSKEMYQEVYSVCKAIVLVTKPFVLLQDVSDKISRHFF